jgi:hypothetical protein
MRRQAEDADTSAQLVWSPSWVRRLWQNATPMLTDRRQNGNRGTALANSARVKTIERRRMLARQDLEIKTKGRDERGLTLTRMDDRVLDVLGGHWVVLERD